MFDDTIFNNDFPMSVLIDEFILIDGEDLGTIQDIVFNERREWEFIIRTNNRTGETVTRKDIVNFQFLSVDPDNDDDINIVSLAEFKEYFTTLVSEGYKPKTIDLLCDSIEYYIRLKRAQGFKGLKFSYRNLRDSDIQTIEFLFTRLKLDYEKTYTEIYKTREQINESRVKYTVFI